MQRSTRHAVAMIVAAAASLGGAAHAQRDEKPLETDRPDFSESSQTVGPGRLQIETSVQLERDRLRDGPSVRTLTTPTLLRIGLVEDFELRIETDGFVRASVSAFEDDPARTVHGFSDVALGVKWHMLDNEGAQPSTAWLLHVDLPTGSHAVRGVHARPSLRTVMEWELREPWSLGVMPGVVSDTRDDGHRYVAGLLAVVAGYEWTSRTRSFMEVAAQQIASSRNGGTIVTYDVGAAHLLTNDVQVDTGIAIGANSRSPDWMWTVGLSVRF